MKNLESPGIGAPGRKPRLTIALVRPDFSLVPPRTSVFSTAGSIRLSVRRDRVRSFIEGLIECIRAGAPALWPASEGQRLC